MHSAKRGVFIERNYGVHYSFIYLGKTLNPFFYGSIKAQSLI